MQPPVLVEILVRRGCAQLQPTQAMVRRVLEISPVNVELSLVELHQDADAQMLGMPGSPTILVNGVDIEPVGDGRTSLEPRTYHDPLPGPLPAAWMFQVALIRAAYPGIERWVFVESGPARWAPLAAALARTWCDAAALADAPLKDPHIIAASRDIGLPVEGLKVGSPEALTRDAMKDWGVVSVGFVDEAFEGVLAQHGAVLRWDVDQVMVQHADPEQAVVKGRALLHRRLRALVGREPVSSKGPLAGQAARTAPLLHPKLGTSKWRRAARQYTQARLDMIGLAVAAGPKTAARRLEMARLERVCQALADKAKGTPLPMAMLAARCGLGPLEQEVLWLALALGWDRELWFLAGGPLMTPQEHTLTGLVLGRFLGLSPLELMPVLSAHSPLRRHGLLVEASAADGRPVAVDALNVPLVVAGHVSALLMGQRSISGELSGVAHVRWPGREGAQALDGPYAEQVLPMLAGFWGRDGGEFESHLADGAGVPQGCAVVLRGPAGSGRVFSLCGIARRFKRRMLVLQGALLSGMPQQERRWRLWRAFEEAALHGELLVVRQADGLLEDRADAAWLSRSVVAHRAAVALCVEPGVKISARSQHVLSLDLAVEPPLVGVGADVWMVNLSEDASMLEPEQIEELSQVAALKPVQVRNALQLGGWFYEGRAAHERGAVLEDYRRAIGAQVRRGQLAQLSVDPTQAQLDDLVLPPETMSKVEQILAAVKDRRQVLDQWRLRERLKKGLSITCLFDGEPGTGKTLTAEVLANQLGLELMRVNISSVVDKYIGETEKNLESIFRYVRSDVHLLLFDEADSLFARRSQKMERSTDRYSNMDINVLLQLIERFEGIAVLTTNLKKSIDPAFERRISFKIHFPRPGEGERERLWRRLLPEEHIPTSEPIDYAFLATMELSGGEIKNAVLQSAYRAARLGKAFDTDLIMESALAEARASGRLVRSHRT